MKTEIEKRASKFIDETDMMQFSTMEIMVMFAEIELRAFKKQLILSGVSCSASDVISKIKNLPESDFSQDRQLKLLRVCGNALGLYKAVKWMQKHYS